MKKFKVFFICIFLFAILFLYYTLGNEFQQIQSNFSESDTIYADISGEFLFSKLSDFNKTSFLIVRNLNYSKDLNLTVLVNVNFELNESFKEPTNNGTIETLTSKSFSMNKSINSFSKTFGEVNLTNDFVSFCFKLIPLNVVDPDFSNNELCFFNESYFQHTLNLSLNVTEIDLMDNTTGNITFTNITNASINLTNETDRDINLTANHTLETNNTESVNNTNNTNSSNNTTTQEDFCAMTFSTDKSFYEEGESISFKINTSKNSFEKGITYWIEDSRKKIVKAKLETKTNTAKKFTPKLERSTEWYFLKGQINTCSNVEELVVFFTSNKEYSEKEEDEFLEDSENDVFPEHSFFNITKAYFDNSKFIILINGFRNSTNKRVVYVSLEGDGVKKNEQKFNTTGKISYFSFEAVFDLSYLKKDSEFKVKIEGIDASFVSDLFKFELETNKTKDITNNLIKDSTSGSSGFEENKQTFAGLFTTDDLSVLFEEDAKDINSTKTAGVIKKESDFNYWHLSVIPLFIMTYLGYLFVNNFIKKRKII